MLRIENLTLRIAGRTLIQGASYLLNDGHKAGLVGRNGSGKTTLFRVISGEMAADDGVVEMRRGMRVGRVAQEAPDGPLSLLETVLAADTERAQLLAEADTAHDPNRIAHIHERLIDIDAHSAPSRAAAILAGLGFDDAAQARRCQQFSGGWRMRVALAAALFARPDVLLLDEPSNHLDLEASLWLESYLANWRGTLLIISHERSLLNKVCNEIVHLEQQTLVRYSGDYDTFERIRRERLMLQSKMKERQEAERARIQSFVDRFRAKATKARQAQSRMKMLARMEPIAAVVEDASLSLHLPETEPLPPPVISIDDADVGYETGKPILRKVRARIDMDDRIALIGANGNGKSTLMKLLAGRLEVQSGTVTMARKLRIGYFAQHQAEELVPDQSAFLHMARRLPGKAPSQVRAHLGRFGFAQGKADTVTASLSGGEKARLLFALMTADKPHILLLDEPTNHLDVDAREALVEALNAFAGAVILVSHDSHLIELVCDRLWLVADGVCTPFDGDMDDYRRHLMEQRRSRSNASSNDDDGAVRRGRRKSRAAARSELAPLRQEARQAEKTVDLLTKRRQDMQTKLADPMFYNGPGGRVADLQRELAMLSKELAQAETAWLTAQEAIEAAGEEAAE